MRSFVAASLAWVLMGWSGSVHAEVLIVDDDGGTGVDFLTIYEAVEQSLDGDVIVVNEGDYRGRLFFPTIIDGKSLTLIAETGADVEISVETFVVRNLAQDQTVVFRGFRSGGFSFQLLNNEGTLWLEDIESRGNLEATIDCRNCQNVILAHSHIEGLVSTIFGTPPTEALKSTDSEITAYECEFVGGIGEGFNDFPGASGVICVRGSFFASGCEMTGGNGGSQSGGDGLELNQGTARLLDSSLSGGSGTPPGLDIQNDSGVVEVLDGVARSYRISSPHRFGETITLSFEGLPFEEVWFPHSFAPTGTYIPHLRGVLVAPPVLLVQIGVADSQGRLEISIPSPEVLGFDAIAFFGQGLFFDSLLGARLGAPSLALLLEP